MPNFLPEDDIEQAMVQRLQHQYGYDELNCHTCAWRITNSGGHWCMKKTLAV